VLEGVTEVEDDEDILIAVADALGEPELFAALGDGALAKILLSALEPFLAFDNPNVRDHAVSSIKGVLAALPLREMQGDGVSLIRQLAVSEFFGPRVAAPPLLVAAYELLSARNPHELDGLRRELRSAFCTLCGDDSPVVRKSAATALSQLLPLLELFEIEGEVYPVLQKVCQDSQDSVRISRSDFHKVNTLTFSLLSLQIVSVDSILAFLRINNDRTNSQAMSHVFELSQDKYDCPASTHRTFTYFYRSWRVRYMVAERYGQLLDAIPDAGTRKTFVPCLIKLMQDEEAEVRTAAAFQVASTCKSNPDADVVASVLSCVKQLVEDPNQHVRAALASVVLDLAPSLGRDRTIKDLLPHFLLLLRDDFHEVVRQVISPLLLHSPSCSDRSE
jgi:serine/threonine-protein phosphatase 2A regulatory subunit A